MLENRACLLAEVSIPETKTLQQSYTNTPFRFQKFFSSVLLGVVRILRNILHQNHEDDHDDQLQSIDLRSITLYICFLSVNIARYFKPINLRSDGIRSLKLNGNLLLKDCCKTN